MFAYISGELAEIQNQRVVIDVHGLGYSIAVPNSILSRLPAQGAQVKLYTYLQIREDGQELYGFLDREEKALFEKLLTVTGIGPKVAIGMLSALTPNQLALAILTGDIKVLSSAPGIGKKTAQRLVLELKDKMDPGSAFLQGAMPAAFVIGDRAEAMEALMGLGYAASDAERALAGIDEGEKDVSRLVTLALKNLDTRRR